MSEPKPELPSNGPPAEVRPPRPSVYQNGRLRYEVRGLSVTPFTDLYHFLHAQFVVEAHVAPRESALECERTNPNANVRALTNKTPDSPACNLTTPDPPNRERAQVGPQTDQDSKHAYYLYPRKYPSPPSLRDTGLTALHFGAWFAAP